MNSFEFVQYNYQKELHTCLFTFKLTQEGTPYSFTEKLVLPSLATKDIPQQTLNEILLGVHLALGMSYWKLYCPKVLIVTSGTLTKEQSEYWNQLYTYGLGEFYYRNKIDFRDLVHFPFEEIQKKSEHIELSQKALVGIGGGKDSIVTAERMKTSSYPFSAFIVETQKEYPLLDAIIEQIGVDATKVQRIIDPQLFELNKQSDSYNGHVPISSVYAWIGTLTAALYDFRYVIVSNERSANYGSVDYLGMDINHQWSKSEEFEKKMQQFIHTYISPDITYFSLLRPYSEMKVVELFSKYPQYFPIFSSCNRNFVISKDKQSKLWCGECPKCAFVFVLLAAYLPKEKMIEIFGENLLDKKSLEIYYRELLALSGIKPFECVGTPEETSLALYKIHDKKEYTGDYIMSIFENEILPTLDVEKIKSEVLVPVSSSLIPQQFQSLVS